MMLPPPLGGKSAAPSYRLGDRIEDPATHLAGTVRAVVRSGLWLVEWDEPNAATSLGPWPVPRPWEGPRWCRRWIETAASLTGTRLLWRAAWLA